MLTSSPGYLENKYRLGGGLEVCHSMVSSGNTLVELHSEAWARASYLWASWQVSSFLPRKQQQKETKGSVWVPSSFKGGKRGSKHLGWEVLHLKRRCSVWDRGWVCLPMAHVLEILFWVKSEKRWNLYKAGRYGGCSLMGTDVVVTRPWLVSLRESCEGVSHLTRCVLDTLLPFPCI